MPTESPSAPAAKASSVDTAGASRRKLLLGTAAALSGVAGAGVAWWRHQPRAAAVGAADAFWSQSFATLSGAPLAMQTFRGRPLVLNFWATWCPPCVEELPLLDAFYQQNSPKGWNVLGLAVDRPESVRAFLQKIPLRFPVALAGLSGTDLSKALGNLSGGLPFTVVFGATGAVAHRKIGQVTPADLAQWVALG